MKLVTRKKKAKPKALIKLPPQTLFFVMCGVFILFLPMLTIRQKQDDPAIEFIMKMVLIFAFMLIGGFTYFKQPKQKEK